MLSTLSWCSSLGGKAKIKSRCYWWKSFCPELRLRLKDRNAKPQQYMHCDVFRLCYKNHMMNRKDTRILFIFHRISAKICPKLNFKTCIQTQLGPSDTRGQRRAQKRWCSYSFPMHSAVSAVFHAALYISNIFLLGFPALGKCKVQQLSL